MIKLPPNLQELENFNIIPYNEFLYREITNLHRYKEEFDIVSFTQLDRRRNEQIDRIKSPILKDFDSDLTYFKTRATYKFKDKVSGIPMHFNTQGSVRFVQGSDIMLFLNFPIKELGKYIERPRLANKGTRHIYDEFIQKLNTIGWTGDNYYNLKKDFHLKYNTTDDPEQYWEYDYFPEYEFFYKKHGMLTIPVLDRYPSYFVGSTHTVFHLNELGVPYVPSLLTIPQMKNRRYITDWYGYIPIESFNCGKFFLFYIDILTKSFYSKVYEYEENKTLYQSLVDKSFFQNSNGYFNQLEKIY